MATQQNARKTERKQPRGKPRGRKHPRTRTSAPDPAPAAEVPADSDVSDIECPSPRERCKTDKRGTLRRSKRTQFLKRQAEMKLLEEEHGTIRKFDWAAFREQCKTSDAPQEVTQSSEATGLDAKSLQEVDFKYVLSRAEKEWDSVVLDALEKRHEAKMQKLEKLGNIIFRRDSIEKQRREYFRTFAWCLSRGNDEHALDAYIGCKKLFDIVWDADNCQLRKDVEALADAGQNTIPGFFIKTIKMDKRVRTSV